MVRTVPNTSSRRTITRRHPRSSSTSPTPVLVNRNNLNRFFDPSNFSKATQQALSHHHHEMYPRSAKSLSRSSKPYPGHRTQPTDYSTTAKTCSRKSVSKSHFLGVLIPRYPPAIKKPSGLSRSRRALISNINPVHQSSTSLNKNHEQAIKKRTGGKPISDKEKLKPQRRKAASICYNSSLEYPASEVVTEENFEALLDLNEVVVDHQRYQPGDAVFVVPDENIPEDSQADCYWLALIKEIKHRSLADYHPSARGAEKISWSEVVLKVEWFYRIDDFEDSVEFNPVFQKVVEKLKKFGIRSNQSKLNSNDFRFQDKELIRTDHSSIIHINSLAGKADVYKFDDQLPPDRINQPVFTRCAWQALDTTIVRLPDDDEQTLIGVESYYYRLHLRFNHQPKTRKHSRRNSRQPNGLLQSISLLLNKRYGCKCSSPYDPHEGMMVFDFKRVEWVHMSCLIAQLEHGRGTDKTGLHHHTSTNLPVKGKKAQGMRGQEQTDLLEIKSALIDLFTSPPSTSSPCATSSNLSHFFDDQSRCLLRGLHFSLAGQFC